MALLLASPAFPSAEQTVRGTVPPMAPPTIPARYARDGYPGGQNISMPYSWTGAPEGTQSFVLTFIDTAPVAHHWVHWLVVDVPAGIAGLAEGASGGSAMPSGAVELRNTLGASGYGGPQPPRGTGVHPYVATVYALDVPRLDVQTGATIEQVRQAMGGHVLATATLVSVLGR